jgi:hypothetical protein
MNRYITVFFAFLLVALFSCVNDNEAIPNQKSLKYVLHQAGSTPVTGTVVFKEIGFGKIEVIIDLSNTPKDFDFPAHLHFGSISEVGELAYRLNDVKGKTGKSITLLDQVTLNTNELVTLSLIEQLNGSVKIHLGDLFFKQSVIAYGNIGLNKNYISDGMAVCIGH